MKAKAENSTKRYETVDIEGTGYKLEFTKAVYNGETTISANSVKGEGKSGFVNYKPGDKAITIQVNGLDKLDQLPVILETIARCVIEVAAE